MHLIFVALLTKLLTSKIQNSWNHWLAKVNLAARYQHTTLTTNRLKPGKIVCRRGCLGQQNLHEWQFFLYCGCQRGTNFNKSSLHWRSQSFWTGFCTRFIRKEDPLKSDKDYVLNSHYNLIKKPERWADAYWGYQLWMEDWRESDLQTVYLDSSDKVVVRTSFTPWLVIQRQKDGYGPTSSRR